MPTYISPSLPGMIRNLWKSDPSERSVRTALNLAGDLRIEALNEDPDIPNTYREGVRDGLMRGVDLARGEGSE